MDVLSNSLLSQSIDLPRDYRRLKISFDCQSPLVDLLCIEFAFLGKLSERAAFVFYRKIPLLQIANNTIKTKSAFLDLNG